MFERKQNQTFNLLQIKNSLETRNRIKIRKYSKFIIHNPNFIHLPKHRTKNVLINGKLCI